MTVNEFIQLALQEDIQEGDHTSLACIDPKATREGYIIAKENGVIAGLTIAKTVFNIVDATVVFKQLVTDGDTISIGQKVVEISGNAISILTAERLALNFMQRMSGVATLTRAYVDIVQPYKAKILDTRKTTPMFRKFQKEAVKLGGGHNHRFGLYDMLMIKDNHIAYAGGIENAIDKANAYLVTNNLDLKIEIESTSIEEIKQILAHGKVHRIMIDNFSVEAATAAVGLINGRYETEISGNINLDTVAAYAATGVDYISVGALTHSAKSLDLSLKAN